MGITLGLLSKFGLPGVSSLTTDQLHERFFKQIKEFEEFHKAFINLCKFLNDVMPGKHFEVPETEVIKDFFENNWTKIDITDTNKRKDELTKFVKDKVKEIKTDDKAVIITGLVIPAAAVMLKNSAENIPQVKRFKLHLVPNFVFVPTCTLLALAGVQLMQISKKSKP